MRKTCGTLYALEGPVPHPQGPGPPPASSPRRRYDPFGAISITAALLVVVYAISQAPQAGWAAAQTVAMPPAGAALLVVFFVIETKIEAPLLPLPLFRLSSVAGSNAAGFLP